MYALYVSAQGIYFMGIGLKMGGEEGGKCGGRGGI